MTSQTYDVIYTCVSAVAVTDDLVGTCIQPAGVAVLISTAFAARAHARTTRVSGTRSRVAIVTIRAPANIARNVAHF